jgi:PAS domain S-box-containing protein
VKSVAINQALRVLIVDDVDKDAILAEAVLRRGGYNILARRVDTAVSLDAALADQEWDVILCDFSMPRFSGLEALALIRQRGLDLPVILLSGAVGEETAVAALQAGADDYIMKGNLVRLVPSVRRALHEVAERRQRRQAEDALRFQADLLKTVGQAIVATDMAGLVTYWNRAAQIMYGWSAAEAIGRNILDLLPTEPLSIGNAERLNAVMDGEPSSQEYWVRDRDGRVFPILASTVPLRGEDGAVVGVIGVSTDISSRVQAEEAMRRSEARTRAQFQGLPVPTYTWQRQGDDWILVDYNRAAGRITWVSMEKLLGASARAVYGAIPEVWDNFTRCWTEQTTIETAAPYHIQMPGVDKDFLISYVFVPTDMVLVHTIDVTERARAQAAAARHVEQLSALRAIDTAIMNSIDLRPTLDTLLAQIIGQLHVDAALILVLDKQTHTLEPMAEHGFQGAGVAHLSLRLGQGLAGQVALERRLISIPALASSDVARPALFTEEYFVGYVGAPLIAKGQVQGVLEVFQRTPLAQEPEWSDFLLTLAGQVAIAIDNATLYTDLQQSNTELVLAYDTTIEGWSRALDLRDKETEGHSRRVTERTVSLSQAMGMSSAELVQVRRGSLLHDIGKMGVPDAILLKPGPLTEEEWVLMRRHPTYAYDLLSPISYLQPALDIPYCHHEKWDGTGYPRGLAGEQIPRAARIFAVIDVVDALLSDRPYRQAWSAERVQDHIAALSGSHFDPAVVAVFLKQAVPAAQ